MRPLAGRRSLASRLWRSRYASASRRHARHGFYADALEQGVLYVDGGANRIPNHAIIKTLPSRGVVANVMAFGDWMPPTLSSTTIFSAAGIAAHSPPSASFPLAPQFDAASRQSVSDAVAASLHRASDKNARPNSVNVKCKNFLTGLVRLLELVFMVRLGHNI